MHNLPYNWEAGKNIPLGLASPLPSHPNQRHQATKSTKIVNWLGASQLLMVVIWVLLLHQQASHWEVHTSERYVIVRRLPRKARSTSGATVPWTRGG